MQDAVLAYSLRLGHKGRVEILQVASNGITPVSELVQNAHALTSGRIAGEPPDVIVVSEPVYACLGRNKGCARRRDIVYGD